VQGTPEVPGRPVADAGIVVGCEVGAEHGSKGCFDGAPAGIALAALRGVAAHAVSGPRQVGAAGDQAVAGRGGGHDGRDIHFVPHIQRPDQRGRASDHRTEPQCKLENGFQFCAFSGSGRGAVGPRLAGALPQSIRAAPAPGAGRTSAGPVLTGRG